MNETIAVVGAGISGLLVARALQARGGNVVVLEKSRGLGGRLATKRVGEAVFPVEPGKTLAHIEFTRDGRYALASVWEMDGALIVYDATTFKEVQRLPMSKPVGKYNVWNKISRSEGTSH